MNPVQHEAQKRCLSRETGWFPPASTHHLFALLHLTFFRLVYLGRFSSFKLTFWPPEETLLFSTCAFFNLNPYLLSFQSSTNLVSITPQLICSEEPGTPGNKRYRCRSLI